MNLVDHCCTATYKHQSRSLHQTIERRRQTTCQLHINRNTFKTPLNIDNTSEKYERSTVFAQS